MTSEDHQSLTNCHFVTKKDFFKYSKKLLKSDRPYIRDGPQISLYKAFHWFIIMSSTISLVLFKICLPSNHVTTKIVVKILKQPIKLLMT